MMKIQLAMCFFYILVMTTRAHSQEETIVFEFFDEDAGLPDNAIFEVFQDRSGVMWFGSDNGLMRYDGFDFKTFRYEFNNPNGLVSNKVRSIDEDEQGRLWVGTANAGMSYTDPYKRGFNTLSLTGDVKTISSSIYDVEIDREQRLWIAGNKGLQIFREIDGQFLLDSIPRFASLTSATIDSMKPKICFLDQTNKMWIGTEMGICFIDLTNSKYIGPQSDSRFSTNEVDDVKADQNGTVWFSVKNKGPRFAYFSEAAQKPIEFDQLQIASASGRLHFTFDKDNRLWAAAFGDRLYGWDFRDSMLFLDSKKNSNVVQERFIRRPFVDETGNVWVPSLGFFKYNYSRGFKNYLHPFDFSQSSTAIYVDDENMWLAYREQGMVHIMGEQAVQYSRDQKQSHRIPTNLMREIIRLKDGRLLATGLSNLCIIDEKNQTIKSTRLNGISRGVLQDSRDDIYVGGFDGLVKIDLNGQIVKTYTLPPYLGERRNFIQGVVEDENGNIWFGSQIMGLAMLNPTTQEIKRFMPQNTATSLHTTKIVDLCMGPNNVLWIGTDLGLVMMDIDKEEFTTHTSQDGLVNDFICAVLVGDNGKVYTSTLGGISEFDPATLEFINYDQTDGLLNRSYYDRSKHIHNGIIYFGGNKGLDYFDPLDIRPPYSELEPQFMRIKVNNTLQIPIDSLRNMKELSLKHSDDLLELEFGATHYIREEKITYEYKMPELVEDWISLSDQRRILFSDLASGSYQLRIRARRQNKASISEELQLDIAVETPFWETPWFRLCVLALLVIGIFGWIRYREVQITVKEKRESQIKQTILQLEKKALLAQMNPHFIFNSMNAIQQFMGEQNYENAMRYLTKFSRLLRQVLKNSEADYIPIDDEIQLINNYLQLEDLRFTDRFEHSVHISPSLDVGSIMIPPFLIQPHVARAVQQSLSDKEGVGKVKLTITRVKNLIRVLIEDNGPEVESQGVNDRSGNGADGISIVEERLKLVNNDLGTQKVNTEILKDYEGTYTGRRVELLIDIKQ
jgi:ligand-binding sensor domain-containing protein